MGMYADWCASFDQTHVAATRKTLMTRAKVITEFTSESVLSIIINILARRVNGKASVGKTRAARSGRPLSHKYTARLQLMS
jgi:hypothetical protein